MNRVFISGNSSGIGLGLSRAFLQQGYEVYGCSRRGCPLDGVHDLRVDLTDHAKAGAALRDLFHGVPGFDLVILNAGIVGSMQTMREADMDELKRVMDVNVWANKTVLDALMDSGMPVRQIISMSSGAAVFGGLGWSGYSISKAALNMLTRLYAHEFPDSHVCAIAPGLIDTDMMRYLTEEADAERFVGLQRLQAAYGTEMMQTTDEVADKIIRALPQLTRYKSGSFVDLRQIYSPDEYAELMATKA